MENYIDRLLYNFLTQQAIKTVKVCKRFTNFALVYSRLLCIIVYIIHVQCCHIHVTCSCNKNKLHVYDNHYLLYIIYIDHMRK